MASKMAHNGSLVALVTLEGDVVAAAVNGVLMHQTPAKGYGMGKYFQFRLEADVADTNRIKADPATGIVTTPNTYAAFRFIGVDGQEVEIGKALPEYVFAPPAKVDAALKPVAKTLGERIEMREAAKAASAARKAAAAAEKEAKPAKPVSTVKAANDSKANPKSKSANQRKAEGESVSPASALQKRLRAKREADAAAKATAVVEVASEIVALPTTTDAVMAEIAEIAGALA